MDDALWSLVAAAPEGPDEEAVARSWLSAARTWTARIRGRTVQPADAGLPPDPVMVLSENGVWVEQLNEKVRPTVLGVLRRSFRRVVGDDPGPGFDQSQYVTNYLDASVNRMSGVPDEVYRDVTRSIAEGVQNGESIPKLAAGVRDILTVSGSKMWDNRATLVARTEVTGANSAGAVAAGAQRQIEEGKPMVKTWIATTQPPSSERTRPSHLEADSQTVPLMEPFTVGTSQMQYPGAPGAPVGEVANCRCTVIIRAADEAPTSMEDRQLT